MSVVHACMETELMKTDEIRDIGFCANDWPQTRSLYVVYAIWLWTRKRAISDALPLKTGRGDDIPQIKVRRSSNSDGIRQERTVATLSFAGGAA